MRKYIIHLYPEFIKNFDKISEYTKVNFGLNTALNFYDSVFGIIDKLSDFSEIGAVAYESEKAKDKNIRQLIVKNHRIIYMIENDTVYILTILSARLGPAENLEK